MILVEGSVTRLAGRREYVRVGLTAAFPAADTCQSSNRTLLKIGKLFTAKSLMAVTQSMGAISLRGMSAGSIRVPLAKKSYSTISAFSITMSVFGTS